jgi:hypothetical protein
VWGLAFAGEVATSDPPERSGVGKRKMAMAKTSEKTPPVPGAKTVLLSQAVPFLLAFAEQEDRFFTADFEVCCAILRDVCGEPGTDGLWLICEKGKRRPKWRAMRADVVARLDTAGYPKPEGFSFYAA